MNSAMRASSRNLFRSVSSGSGGCVTSNNNRSTPAALVIAAYNRIPDSARSLNSSSSSNSAARYELTDEDGPSGILFSVDKPPIGPALVGATGTVQRTFGPRSNAEGLLATGGSALAAHASFDPDYDRARDWIRHHAVGPAVLSPILIAGLTGALTEAAFPHGVITAQSMRHKRPLIVGVPVASMIQVVSVNEAAQQQQLSSFLQQQQDEEEEGNSDHKRKHGYNVVLRTVVTRVRDDCVIAEGSHELWVPDYLRM